MKTICQECKLIIQEGPDDPISDGLCKECLPVFMRRNGATEETIQQLMKELEG